MKVTHQKTKNEWDSDEIPGHTSYINRENRFREPHEFADYWKWGDKANHLKKQLGLANDTNEDELLKIVQEQQYDIDRLEDESLNKSDEIDQLYKQLDEAVKDLQKSNTKVFDLKYDRESLRQNIDRLKKNLTKYGTHTGLCNWVVMLQSGRLHGTEEEQCDCDWLGTKL